MGIVTLARPCSVLLVLAVLMAAATGAQAQEGWRWSLTPYVWASDISETLILRDQEVGGQDVEFRDLVDKIDASLQLHLEGVKNRWGLFADVNYVELSDSVSGEQGIVRFDVDVEEILAEGGLIWRPAGTTGKLDLLFGARYLSVDERYGLFLGEAEPFRARIDDSYLDGLLALRLLLPLSERWAISLRGDVSTGDTDYIWTAQGLLGWRFGKRRGSAVFVGYRYRELKYTKGVVEVERTMSGLGLGVKIGF